MDERVTIRNCIKCGGKGLLFVNGDDMRKPYSIKCACGNRSNYYQHIDSAIKNWNEKNQPQTARPTYRCGACGSEIHLGFESCPNCGTLIDWKG